MSLDNTGERFVPHESKTRLVEEHEARYQAALNYVQDKLVLDIACGTGSGAFHLAQRARQVKGVDLSPESIEFAKKNYAAPHLEYQCASVDQDLFPAQTFDVICSFETIEHLSKPVRRQYLKNLKKWIKPQGVLLLSTPNRKITSPFSKKPLNPFHVLEYSNQELIQELSPYFKVQSLKGQRLIPKWLTWFLVRKTVHLIQRILKKNFHFYDWGSGPTVVRYSSRRYEPRIFWLEATPVA